MFKHLFINFVKVISYDKTYEKDRIFIIRTLV